MRYDNRVYGGTSSEAAAAFHSRREAFLVRTYNHLFGAIVLFTLIEIALFKSGVALPIARAMAGGGWLLVMGAFTLVGWLASSAAHRAESKVAQYAALGGFVLAEAIVFVPLLMIAERTAPGAIQSAAMVTILGFGGLSAVAFFSRRDFTFLGSALRWAGIVALVTIVAAAIFGFQLGVFFSCLMVAFAGATILYETSAIQRTFPEDRHVAAALQLFSSVAMMFWYVLRLFVGSRR